MEKGIVTEGKCSQKAEITYGDKSYRLYSLDGKHHEDREEMTNDFLKMEANEFHAKWHKYWTKEIPFKPQEHPTDNNPVQPPFFNEHAK